MNHLPSGRGKPDHSWIAPVPIPLDATTDGPGTPVTFNLEIERGLVALHSTARVVRVVGPDGMGIQFENLGSQECNRLQQFLLPLILAVT